MSLIVAEHIQKTYITGDVKTPVLHGLSFTIDSGEFLAIMGPSGSGKSTLLHILGFLDGHTGGTYLFNGKASEAYTDDEKAHVRNSELGFVFQSFNLLPRESIYGNVRLPLIYSAVPEGEWDTRIRQAIESVGLTHRIEHDPAQLSGGEKQRVAIARALVLQPSIIFADEPTGNLDTKSGEIVMEVLDRLHNEGHTIILITHESETARFAERIIYIRDGRIESDEKVDVRRKNGEGSSLK